MISCLNSYQLILSKTAIRDLEEFKKSGNKAALKKIQEILKELRIHPLEGIGQPELLKHQLRGFHSRRINKKDRLVYRVNEEFKKVEILQIKTHYNNF